jgi:FkbH-like protein
VPKDPAEYIAALDHGLWFETVMVTGEDRQRVDQYRAARLRREAEVAFESIDGYLESLEMYGDIQRIDDNDLDRVVQLIGKTNQFNLTTRRHSQVQVRQMLSRPGTVAMSLRLTDRFGDHGLVSVLIAIEDATAGAGTLQIDTWLMSCRVINRTAEDFLFNRLVETARSQGFRQLAGSYVPTAKNALVKSLYDRLGFSRREVVDAEPVLYDLDLALAAPAKTFVRDKSSKGSPCGAA